MYIPLYGIESKRVLFLWYKLNVAPYVWLSLFHLRQHWTHICGHNISELC